MTQTCQVPSYDSSAPTPRFLCSATCAIEHNIFFCPPPLVQWQKQMEVSSTCQICNKYHEELAAARASSNPADLLAVKEQHKGHYKFLETARKEEARRRKQSGRGDEGALHTNVAFDVMDSKKTELPWFKTVLTRNAIKGHELMPVKVRQFLSPTK